MKRREGTRDNGEENFGGGNVDRLIKIVNGWRYVVNLLL